MRLIDADKAKSRAIEVNSISPWSLRSVLLLLDAAPTIEPPPNDPLTLEELREMDGEPVWVVCTPDVDGETLALWALVSVDRESNEVFLQNNIGGKSSYEDAWTDIEAIYRRRPEEGVHGT